MSVPVSWAYRNGPIGMLWTWVKDALGHSGSPTLLQEHVINLLLSISFHQSDGLIDFRTTIRKRSQRDKTGGLQCTPKVKSPSMNHTFNVLIKCLPLKRGDFRVRISQGSKYQ